MGFPAKHLQLCAKNQDFEFGRCIYEADHQERICAAAVAAVVSYANEIGPAPETLAHPSQSYFHAFQACESDLLRIAALLKHDAFEAEAEWRAVSAPISDFRDETLSYRGGRSTLVPYRPFRLTLAGSSILQLVHTIHGPTPHTKLGLVALSHMLAKFRVNDGVRRISPSRVPYRET